MTDKQLLHGILNNKSHALEAVYDSIFPSIMRMVVKNSGSKEDAEDIFQESLVVVYRRLELGSLQLECALKTYLYAVCRNLWMEKLRKTDKFYSIKDTYPELIDLDADTLLAMEREERYALYREHFEYLGPDCKKLLRLFFEGISMKEIAEEMDYSSEKYARKKKFLCKEHLIELIKSDPRFNELRNMSDEE